MWPKIKKLNILVCSLGKQSITSSREKRKILIRTLVMKYEKGVSRVWSYCLQATPFVSIIGFDLLKSCGSVPADLAKNLTYAKRG